MLDIIIPTYNNLKGLYQTINSIPQQSGITITVINDNSTDCLYDNFLWDYPDIHFFTLDKNEGPGNARQYGISNTKEPFIMFIDTGDELVTKTIPMVLNVIKNNPDIWIYSWPHYYGKELEKISAETHNRLHGRVYNRAFLNKFNIHFCPNASRANEDIGFNRFCRLCLKNSNQKNHLWIGTTPIYNWITDENSITAHNNHEWRYKDSLGGLAINEISIIDQAIAQGFDEEIIKNEVSEVIASTYFAFLSVAKERQEFILTAWQAARLLQNTLWEKHGDFNCPGFIAMQTKVIRSIKKKVSTKEWVLNNTINLRAFIKDLNDFQYPPEKYYNF